MDYKEFNDFELLSYIGEQNEEANEIMYKKYQPLIKSLARQLFDRNFSNSFELNDLIQEGMIGLNKAIVEFNDSKETIFYTFAYTCIKTTMISYIVKHNRQKNKILNESISLEIEEDDYKKNEFMLEDNSLNPEVVLINNEFKKELMQIAKNNLTSFELEVFELKLKNFNYKEIAEILKKDSKSIDNALQRIKSKMKYKIN
ncbi:MAG: sigma-70 family RNA polymerase sigma factor [Mycoplasmatota bacterium]